jgi:hypothetical protein
MSKKIIFASCIVFAGLFVFLDSYGTRYGGADLEASDVSETYLKTESDSNPVSMSGLYVLLYEGGNFIDFNVDIESDELDAYLPAHVVDILLDGYPVRLSTPDAIAAVRDLLGQREGIVLGETTGSVTIAFTTAPVPADWSCIKCCYSDPPLACCCKPKED